MKTTTRIRKLIQGIEEKHTRCMEDDCTCTCKACGRRRDSNAMVRRS